MNGRTQEMGYTEEVSLFKYTDKDGRFDYEQYVKAQVSGNIQKLHHIWADEGYIHFLCSWMKKNLPSYAKGICHGTRNGAEMKYFRKHLEADVIGTEISPTAKKFANTIQWDFHDLKEEWYGNFDFIYSNSFDHSYNPEYCIKQWMLSLKKTGACFIEHSSADMGSSEMDPFGASYRSMQKLINYAGNGEFHVSTTLTPKVSPEMAFRGSTWGELPNVVYYVVQYKNRQA